MKNYTTTEIAEFNYTVDYAYSVTAGHGHRTIVVSIVSDRNSKEFQAVTSNMAGYDAAMELEEQERYEALFELVQGNLDGEIAEWLS